MKSVPTILCVMTVAISGVFVGTTAFAHCEIPCGIYGDRMRLDLLNEHKDTIEKSMRQIRELQAAPGENANQLVRWVTNKEEHANKVQEIVYQYFMNQRVQPVMDQDAEGYQTYINQITLLHRMLVTSMKCKQTTDLTHAEALQSLLDAFEKSYFSDEERQHQH